MIHTKWNPFKIEKDNPSSAPPSFKSASESIRPRLDSLARRRTPQSLNPLFVQLFQRVKDSLGSIRNYTQISRGKFSDREFGEYYYRVMTEDIEKIDVVLNSLIDYMKLRAPIKRMNTVHTLIEEVLKKHQVKLEEKGIRVLERFEKDLPETVVPDEQLRYVLGSVLEYAMVVTPPRWNIALSTKSFLIETETGEAKGLFKRDGKQIEISVAFAVHQRPSVPAPGMPLVPKADSPDILLRLAKEVVLRNHGIMKVGVDEKRTKSLISLRFPAERRSVTYYPSGN